jgi:hypothetical protein
VRQVRARDILWQKERLLNLGVSLLPKEARKVAWLDSDILFTNPDWAVQTADALATCPVVQPFATRKKYLAGNRTVDERIGTLHSFAFLCSRDPGLVTRAGYFQHGSTGFAWAAQRDILDEHGLYDALISGIGDHLMPHAMFGDFASPCVRHMFESPLADRVLRPNSPLRRMAGRWLPRGVRDKLRSLEPGRNYTQPLFTHFASWGRGIHEAVKGRMNAISGTVFHLWHGDNADRRYLARNRELLAMGFDPTTDIRIGASGCWEWASDKPDLQRWAGDMFVSRREDGP